MACGPNMVPLLCMLALTFLFFVVEVVVSRVTASLAMLSDSFHMLSDVIALVVALIAVRFAGRTQATDKNTFGWIRAEVMGALVNAVFLTALCFTIVLEAIERFSEAHEIEQPLVVIWVGAGGLLVNLVGLCMFRGGAGHGHSHGGGGGGHGHSHGPKKSPPKRERNSGDAEAINREETNTLVGNSGSNGVSSAQNCASNHGDPKNCVDLKLNGNVVHEDNSVELEDASSQLNMRGVFLHVLGDALGSVIVVVNATIFYFIWKQCPAGVPCTNPCVNSHFKDHVHAYVNHTAVGQATNESDHGTYHEAGPCWVLYLDPSLCLIMVCILLYTTFPLLKESALILLQTVPKQIDIHSLSLKLGSIEGVEAVHELHVWQLAGSRIIATAHIKCHDPPSYMDVAKRIKDFFHNEGIHATTIQPEFSSVGSELGISLCELPCRTQCALKQCCAGKKIKKTGLSALPDSESINDSPKSFRGRTNTSERETAVVVVDSEEKQFESCL
ncbi:proton-coupled zinc antiporter SLC30A1 [Ambystoma mexicanum]|uniref:proton-coupled zinc antiporter SLC30A1 n=1 Tax=Ambystoma mexicanum TaxID=8296 RepID=UPI0037E88C4C